MLFVPTYQTFLGLITVVGVITAYVSGVWGIYGHFTIKDKVESAMKFTSALSLAGLIWFLFERWQHEALIRSSVPASDIIALALLAVFMLLFWWTVAVTRSRRLTLAFSKDQPKFIYTTGPYKWVAHPFYMSYLIFWVAVAIAADTWIFCLIPAAMFILYRRAIKLEEAKFAASPVSSEYATYRARRLPHLFTFRSDPKSSSGS